MIPSLLENWYLQNRQELPNFQLDYQSKFQERRIYLKNPPHKFDIHKFNWDNQNDKIVIIGSVFQEFNHPDIFDF